MTNDPVRVYYDADADRGRLSGRTFAIIGYGSQGHAHALNLRDSGARGRRRPPAGRRLVATAKAAGLDVRPVAEAAAAADVIMMLTPDQDGRADLRGRRGPDLTPGKTLMFAHGFNIHYGEIAPPAGVDVTMVAPKSPGHLVRSEFEGGGGVPGARRRAPGRERPGAAQRAGLRRRDRLYPGGRHRDHLPRGDRDRPLRRAGGALRRRHGAGEGRASRPSPPPATGRRWPTSSACTSSS